MAQKQQDSETAAGTSQVAPIPPHYMATPGLEPPTKYPPVAPMAVPPATQRMNADPYAQVGSATGQWLLRRPASSATRLIIDFFPDACCGDAIVLKEDDLNQVPPELAARGVAQEEWSTWMHTLKDVVNGNNLSVCTCVTLSMFVIPLPYVYCVLIAQQKRVKEFCDAINGELFEPRGMFFKTQRSSITIKTGEDSQYTENVYWIAISLTPEDAEQLKADEHLFSGWGPSHWSCKCCNDSYKYLCCCGVEPQF